MSQQYYIRDYNTFGHPDSIYYFSEKNHKIFTSGPKLMSDKSKIVSKNSRWRHFGDKNSLQNIDTPISSVR